MASSSPLLFLLVLAAAFHAAAAAPVPARAQVYCRDTLAGLMECGSFVFGGAEKPSRACCAAYRAVYASEDGLCLCYVDDGTFWRAAGYDVDNVNATGDSVRIPELCGQLQDEPAPIEFWCEESRLPPYGPQGTPAAAPYVSDLRGRAVPTGQPPAPSGSSSSASVAATPASTLPPSPPPPASKAKRDSSP